MDLHAITKVCSKCRIEQPVSAFHFHPQTRDRLDSWCKACKRVSSDAWAARNRARRRQSGIRRREERELSQNYIHVDRKVCRLCLAEKLAPDFYKRSDARDGLANHCKACDKKGGKGWRLQNKGGRTPAHIAWAESNPEALRASRKKWKRANPLKVREHKERRRVLIRGNTVGPVDYEAIWERDQGICHICQKTVKRIDTEFDHVVPISKGGAHSMGNIKVAHMVCNRRKHDKIIECATAVEMTR